MEEEGRGKERGEEEGEDGERGEKGGQERLHCKCGTLNIRIYSLVQ